LVETSTADVSRYNASNKVKTRSEIFWTISGDSKIWPRLLSFEVARRIHDAFHVSLLKKFEGMAPTEVPQLPQILHGKVVPTPERVVRAHLNRGVWELLVKWQGRSEADTTWEQLEEFKRMFPEVELKDELFGDEGGNVVDAFVGRQYQCQNK
jgi:hypothetical protein